MLLASYSAVSQSLETVRSAQTCVMKHNVGWVFVICVSDFYGFRWGVSGSRQHIRQMLARQHVVCLEALTEPSRCLRVVVGKRMSKAHVFVMPKVLGFQETQEVKFLTQCTF